MPHIPHTKLLARKISDFCRLRVEPILPPQESARVRNFLIGLIALSQTPPRKLRGYDWEEIALKCGLDNEALVIARSAIEPALDAIVRNMKGSSKLPPLPVSQGSEPEPRPQRGRPRRLPAQKALPKSSNATPDRAERQAAVSRKQPGVKPRMIEEFPTPLFEEWIDPTTFQEALALHMRRHGDSY